MDELRLSRILYFWFEGGDDFLCPWHDTGMLNFLSDFFNFLVLDFMKYLVLWNYQNFSIFFFEPGNFFLKIVLMEIDLKQCGVED